MNQTQGPCLPLSLQSIKSLQIEDETDELLLADDELFDVDPEALPRRLLSHFSVYNSEVRTAPLALTDVAWKQRRSGTASRLPNAT